MVLLLLLFTIGLGPVASDKLTGTEIPPTAAYSDGTFEDLQLPLESFDIIVKEVEERKYNGDKESIDEFIKHSAKNKATNETQPQEEVAIEEKNKPIPTQSIEYNKYDTSNLNTSQNVAEDNNPYRFKVNGGKLIIVLPQNSSQTEVSPVQNKSYNTNKLSNLTSSTTNITKIPDSNYLHVFSKGGSSLPFDRHKPTTIIANIDRTSHPRIKSKNTIEIIRRRNPFLNKIDANSKTLNRQNVINETKFSHTFSTSNGIHREEIGTANDGVKVEGSYSYVGDDGKTYTVRYTADENGFRPQGDHIPFLPEVVRKVTEPGGVYDDGSYDEAKYGHLNYENIFVRRAYKQDLRRNSRRRIHKFNQGVNNAGRVRNHKKSHNYTNTKLNTVNSSDSDETKLTSTENNIVLESIKNVKQTYTIKRRPRKFNIGNGFNKLYVVNTKSTKSQNDLKPYRNDNNNGNERNKKALNEFSKTFATVGYLYGPPINKFNVEEQLFSKNKAEVTDEIYHKTSSDNEKISNVKLNFKTNNTEVELNFDKMKNPLDVITKPYYFRNKNDNISKAAFGKVENTVPQTKFITSYKQPTQLLEILDNMKPQSNITDEILLLRKLFGLPNATKIDDFKISVVPRPKENVNEFKSLFSSPKSVVAKDILNKTSSPNLIVNEGILNKTTVVNVEEVLKSIFGTGENGENSNIHTNLNKETNQLNKTDEKSDSLSKFKEENNSNNVSSEKTDTVDENTNIFKEFKENEVLIGKGKGEDFSGPKQIPKFDPLIQVIITKNSRHLCKNSLYFNRCQNL